MTSRPSSPRWLRIVVVTVSLGAVTTFVVWSQTRHHTPAPTAIPLADPSPRPPVPVPTPSTTAPAPAPAAATVQVPAPAPAEPIDRAVYFSSSKSALAPSFDPPAAASVPDAGSAADVDAR